MIEKQVTTRQACLILILAAVSTKLLFLPSLLCQEVGRDAYVYVFIFMLLEILTLTIFLHLSKKFPNYDAKQLFEYCFGKVVSKAILLLYLIYFVVQTSVVFQSAYVYLYENLYANLKWYVYVFPLLLTLAYVAYKGLNSIARLFELFIPIVFVGVVMALFLGGINADYSNALPILENNFFDGIVNVSKYALWFSDYLIFLVLFGHIKTHKNFSKNTIMITLVVSVIVSVFILIFYCLFDYSAVFHRNAITDIVQVIPRNSDLGNIDWIVTLVWDITMIIYMCIMFFASTKMCKDVFCIKQKWINIIIVLALIGVIVFLTKFDVARIIKYASGYVYYFYYTVAFVLPIIMLLIATIKRGKQNA